MPVAARKLLGLRAHTLSQQAWVGDFHSKGDVVSDRGHTWRARMNVARGHRPTGPVSIGAEARQWLIDDCSEGWGAGTTGGGLAGADYIVTTAAGSDDTIVGSLPYALKQPDPLWISFDPDVFPLDDPATISLTDNVEMGPDKTIDGRGAGVRLSKFPIEFRTDRGSPLVTNRGLTVANVLVAYVEFIDYPNGTSVIEFGGNNPFRRGGADLVYLHHLTVHDIADQNMSHSHHDNNVSRSTMDWCKFGPNPGPIMMSLTKGGGLKLFQVDSTDVTNNTLTTLDGLGLPTNHDLISVTGGGRGNWTFDAFMRSDLTAHPFPAGITAGNRYSVRHVGQSGQAQKNFTASSATNTITSASHGYVNGNPVILIGSTLPDGLRNGYIYFVRDATANTFRLSLTAGGGQKGFTTDGSGTMKVQKADLTKFQLSTSANQSTWTPVDITGQGSGWFMEETEPLYFENGKGPQWGSHHADDVPDSFMTFNVAANTVNTLRPHLIANGQRIRFWDQSAGALPTQLTEGATYYARDVTSTTFKVASALGGTALTLTGGAAEQAVTFTSGSDDIGATSNGLANGDMVAFYGASLPAAIDEGIVYWVKGTPATNTLQIAARKGDDPLDLSTWSGTKTGTMVKKPPLVQLLIGPNRVSITKCDFDRLKIRSPKIQISWAHLWNNRVQKWGDPDRGDDVGGFGNELADGAQVLIEDSIYRPYSSSGTEAHYWSAFTNPREDVPVRGRSIYGINVDSGSLGAVDTRDWTGGTSVIQRNNLFEDGATTRAASAQSDTSIPNAAALDWYDPADPALPVPYDYDPIPVTVDPFILDTILDRGCGNVQPWELVS